jgi:SnoaL-like domain
MRLSIILPAVLASLSFAAPYQSLAAPSQNCSQYSQYEAIHQAEYKLANTMDTKNWAILHESMTQDVVYDNSAFGPGKGGVSTGLDEVIKNTKAAFGDSMVEHIVANARINIDDSGERANVIT